MTKPRKNRDDNEGDRPSGQEGCSRCSPTKFISVMEQLVPKLGELQLKRIETSPLAPWLKIQKLSISTSRVNAMLKRFEVETCSFIFGSTTMVPFTSSDFSIVIGLPSVGQPVNIDLKLASNFLQRHFKGMNCVKRNAIKDKLFELAESDLEIDDFFRVFILLLFNCVIFPISNFGTPKFIFPYLDNLETFFEYAWGDAAFRFLRAEIEDHLGFCKARKKDKKYMGGCIVGLMAWVYERVPMLGEPRVLYCFPCLFKWGESKIPVNPKRAEAVLKAVRANKIVPIKPFREEKILVGEEKILVGEIERFPEDRFQSKESDLLDHIKRLENEIKVLEGKILVFEDDATRSVFKDGSHMYDDVHTEGDVDGDVDPLVKNVDGVVDNNAKMITDCSLKMESVVKVVLDKVQMNPDDGVNEQVGSDIGEGKEMIDSNPKSSIVKTVQKRTDRLKKRKYPDYMTPPDTTPKRKIKQRSTELLDLDDIDVSSIGKSAIEESLQEFRGREDYSGHDQLSTEHRTVIENYLCGDTLGGVVWQDDTVILYGHELLLCLFGEWLRSDVIHAYFNILSNEKDKYGHEIYCMSPNVQINVIAMMEKTNQKKLKNNDFSEFTSKLDKSTLSKLSELDTELLQRCKHLLFPIAYRSHWTLLVYTTSNQCFSLRDSISGAVYKGAAKKFAKFLSGYLWNVKKCDIGQSEVIGMKCRQQENDANGGVYVCLWGECFARDNPEFWNEESETSIEGYRSQIAATILSDERGLLKGLK